MVCSLVADFGKNRILGLILGWKGTRLGDFPTFSKGTNCSLLNGPKMKQNRRRAGGGSMGRLDLPEMRLWLFNNYSLNFKEPFNTG